MKQLFIDRVWNSPTITTWASFFVKSGNVIFVLPLILINFSAAETALWFALTIIVRLRDLFDFGVLANLARFFSYAISGVKNIEKLEDKPLFEGEPNYELLAALYQKGKTLYGLISLLAFVALSMISYFSLRNIMLPEKFIEQLLCGILVVLGSTIFLFGNFYISILIGINKVALMRRWDTFFGTLSLLATMAFLLIDPKLIYIISIMFIYIFLTVIRNALLVKSFKGGLFKNADNKNIENYRYINRSILSRSYRSFVGGFSNFGILQGINLFLLNFGNVELVNAYLLAEKLMEQLKTISRAPFYSRIPQFTMLSVQSKFSELRRETRMSMHLSYSILMIGFMFVLIYSNELLALIDSNTQFVTKDLWYFMGLAAFIERFTSMHSQLHEFIKNKIISYIGLIVTGVLTALGVALFFEDYGFISLPIVILSSYLLFYTWFVLYKNLYVLEENILKLESMIIVPYLLAMLLVFVRII